MVLGINGIRLVVQRSGVARCLEAILRCLGAVEHPFDDIRVYTPARIPDDVWLPPRARNVVLPARLPYGVWEQYTLPRAHGRAGVLFCPSYVVPVGARCPTVLVHHGSYEGYPQAFPWWRRNKARLVYALSAWRASAVSTVSEHSRRDMARFYRIPVSRVHVIPEGVDTGLFRPLHDTAALAAWRVRTFGADVPFVVYVGKPTERRNLSPLIRAFARLKTERRLPHKLLIVGADLPGDSPFRQVMRATGVERDVVVLGHCSHPEMVHVYNAAALLVYPSSYEGFGMPVLEAMACGTPVIALDNTAFPEFAGGVALLLPDAEVDTLVNGIRRVLDSTEVRRAMATEGPRRAAHYDWHDITRRYLELIVPLAERWERARARPGQG